MLHKMEEHEQINQEYENNYFANRIANMSIEIAQKDTV